jgi:protein-S-isoprenylcysteine O-methyltransferase Ste14
MSDSTPTRNAPAWVTIALVLLAVILGVVAVIYFVDSARSLPSFFPGHTAGSTHHHLKHGFAAAIVGVLALVGAWLSSGKKKPA